MSRSLYDLLRSFMPENPVFEFNSWVVKTWCRWLILGSFLWGYSRVKCRSLTNSWEVRKNEACLWGYTRDNGISLEWFRSRIKLVLQLHDKIDRLSQRQFCSHVSRGWTYACVTCPRIHGLRFAVVSICLSEWYWGERKNYFLRLDSYIFYY